MYRVETNINKVFETCNELTDVDLLNDYMYMYSLDNVHYFKNIDTRKYIKVGIQRVY
jgi:hypothetical protein